MPTLETATTKQSGGDYYRASLKGKAFLVAISQAKGSVTQAVAVLKKARQNLEYCTIKSPVKGIVIDRRVNIGQTVVASLNAPSLFLIAKDLRRLQVWVAVNEADIASIHQDQRVVFTVDAFPGETFEGRVDKIRLNANMTQNVVSYIVEVNTDNSGGKLLPYLSANARFIVNEHSQVLMVPNAALKWRPRASAAGGGSHGTVDATGQPPDAAGSSLSREPSAGRGVLWVVSEGGSVRPVQVRVGLTDGSWTEVQAEGIREGTTVVVGERPQTAEQEGRGLINPFAPKPLGRTGGPSRH